MEMNEHYLFGPRDYDDDFDDDYDDYEIDSEPDFGYLEDIYDYESDEYDEANDPYAPDLYDDDY